jgi:hypothetical protein
VRQKEWQCKTHHHGLLYQFFHGWCDRIIALCRAHKKRFVINNLNHCFVVALYVVLGAKTPSSSKPMVLKDGQRLECSDKCPILV